jgi:hypothetical protein
MNQSLESNGVKLEIWTERSEKQIEKLKEREKNFFRKITA